MFEDYLHCCKSALRGRCLPIGRDSCKSASTQIIFIHLKPLVHISLVIGLRQHDLTLSFVRMRTGDTAHSRWDKCTILFFLTEIIFNYICCEIEWSYCYSSIDKDCSLDMRKTKQTSRFSLSGTAIFFFNHVTNDPVFPILSNFLWEKRFFVTCTRVFKFQVFTNFFIFKEDISRQPGMDLIHFKAFTKCHQDNI